MRGCDEKLFTNKQKFLDIINLTKLDQDKTSIITIPNNIITKYIIDNVSDIDDKTFYNKNINLKLIYGSKIVKIRSV